MSRWSCAECANLDKSRIQWSENRFCYRYGCTKRNYDGFICFWCKTDNDLKSGGCSDFSDGLEENEQLSMF